MDLRTKRLGGLGVEIEDLNLRDEVAEGTWQALRNTVIREGLVVLRDQFLPCADQVRLGRRFGELENTSADQGPLEESEFLLTNVDALGQVLAADHPDMNLVAINEGWHTDSSFREVPASFSLFSALRVPEQGGDTFFASLRLGWDALSHEEQVVLYGRYACHDYDRAYRTRNMNMEKTFGGAAPSARHPLVRAHPETGATALYITEHMYDIEDMSASESKRWIARLLEVCTASERVYRHAWSEGDLLMWDNRSMLHRAEGFDALYPRIIRHIRVAGTEAAIAARP